MVRLQAFRAAARRRLRPGRGIPRRNRPVAQKKLAGYRQGLAPAYVHRQPDKQRDHLLDDPSWESKFEDISRRSSAAGMVQVNSGSNCAAMKSTMNSFILPLKILLNENDPAAAAQFRKALAVGGGGSCNVKWVRQVPVLLSS